jgi:WS/DGAT/MGAT family acyltransferase
MARRLLLAPVLHRKLATMPLHLASPVWVEDDAVDLDHHVQRVVLPAPGTRAQLEACVAGLHAELLDRSRPLWQLTVIEGLADGQVGYYFKVHHAALDGQAGVLLARTLFDLTPRPPALRRIRGAAAEHPGMIELGAAALRHDTGQYLKLVRHLPDVLRWLAGLFAAPELQDQREGQLSQNVAFGPHTALNVPITAERGFAGLSLPLDALKGLAAAHDAKLNDVVLALCSGALRRYLAHHGGIPRKPLTAAMPISLREPGDDAYTIQTTMPLVNLQTHIADPVRRLRAIRDAAGAVKAMVRRARGMVPMDFPSFGVPWLLQGLAQLYGRSRIAGAIPALANVVISNIPGPQVPLYAAGARMTTYWPVSVVEHGLGLNITVLSYAGAMGFGFTTARAAVPDAHQLTRALTAAFDELAARTSAATATPRTPKTSKPSKGPRQRAAAASTRRRTKRSTR